MSIADAEAIIESRAAELRAQLASFPDAWRSQTGLFCEPLVGGSSGKQRSSLDALHTNGVTLEIGCGHGHFIAAYGAAHRDEPCLAIDIIAERLERAQKKLDRAGLSNVVLLRSEARLLLGNLPEWLRFRRVFVLFPDPWPKRRHHKNRLLQPDFLQTLAQHCTPDARLYFRTDHAPYFAEVVELLRTHPDWELVGDDEPWGFEQESVFQKRAAGAYQSCIAARGCSITSRTE